jgi:lysozyme
VSADCIALIAHFEGYSLRAYTCPAGKLTIGYGHTGDDVHKGLEWTDEQAKKALMSDLHRFEKGVLSRVTVPLQQHQFDALVSFAYNCGLTNLGSSTLLRLVNEGKFTEAAEQFGRWINKGSSFEKGLTRRRKAERLLFLDMEWSRYDA